MDAIFIFISGLFFLWVIRELFYWLAIWQENEYRQDRFFAALKKKSRRHRSFSTYFQIGKWFFFLSYGFVIFYDDLLGPYQYLVIFLYLVQSFFLFREIFLNHLKKPKITLREVFIIALTLITVLLIFAIPLMDKFFWLLFVDLVTPLVVAFYVLLFAFPTEIYNDWKIEKAVRKIRNHPNLLVIAVTGSVGKSMTKDYIAKILKKKYNVIKTEGKNNTAIGIAHTILQKLEDDTQIFVAEISAYKPGEIAMLCQLIRPKIGVLTSINSYYITLFKSLEEIKKTNYELVSSLPSNGFCLYNGDNKNTLELYRKSRKGKVLYRTTKREIALKNGQREIAAYHIKQKTKRTTFSVRLKNKKVELSLLNSHHIDQLLPALYIASFLGVSEQEIKREVALFK